MNKLRKTISNLLWVVVTLVLCLSMIYFVNPRNINGDSMNPTMKNGEWYLSSRLWVSDIHEGDIVTAEPIRLGKPIVKRVVAVGGDTVKITERGIYINSDLIDNSTETLRFLQNKKTFIGDNLNKEVQVPENQYFLLGDNRDNSNDSRVFGLITKQELKTKVTVKLPKWIGSLLNHTTN